MKSSKILASLLVLFTFAACQTTQPKKLPPETPNPGEKQLWGSESPRPAWTVGEEVSIKGEVVTIVAMSDKFATEKYAREDAEQSARKHAIQRFSTEVKSKIQNVVNMVGVSTDINNPARVQQEFEGQLSKGRISQMQNKLWYLEKWQDPSGAVYWKAFLLSEIPKSILDQALAETMRTENAKLQGQKSNATSDDKKASIDSMMKAFEEIEKNGFTLE